VLSACQYAAAVVIVLNEQITAVTLAGMALVLARVSLTRRRPVSAPRG
jgi:drug/metabolite transporter (DMT)-like permease